MYKFNCIVYKLQLALCTAALLPELKLAPLFPVCHYWTNWL